ncbi:MAG TPA: hypothetical protein VHQ01_11585, partial [Pyrinomonadaceae bacterium]|nr:hypothetical protein [Pyrinomonadaceae bacterium]
FEYNDGRKLQIEFVQEPACPVKISVKSVNLKPEAEAQSISLELENTSSTPIRAYTMVSGGNRYPNLHTWAFPAKPFEPGVKLTRNVWPNSQDHYYFFVDYVLFTDGSVCGLDNYHRSVEIAGYLNGRAGALTRLRELAAERTDPDDFINAVDNAGSGGFMLAEVPGGLYADTVKQMPGYAYQHVMLALQRMDKRRDEAADIAQKLGRGILVVDAAKP